MKDNVLTTHKKGFIMNKTTICIIVGVSSFIAGSMVNEALNRFVFNRRAPTIDEILCSVIKQAKENMVKEAAVSTGPSEL